VQAIKVQAWGATICVGWSAGRVVSNRLKNVLAVGDELLDVWEGAMRSSYYRWTSKGSSSISGTTRLELITARRTHSGRGQTLGRMVSQLT
jgi:hypothetical protein